MAMRTKARLKASLVTISQNVLTCTAISPISYLIGAAANWREPTQIFPSRARIQSTAVSTDKSCSAKLMLERPVVVLT